MGKNWLMAERKHLPTLISTFLLYGGLFHIMFLFLDCLVFSELLSAFLYERLNWYPLLLYVHNKSNHSPSILKNIPEDCDIHEAFGCSPPYLALLLLICTSSANTGITNVNPAIDNGSNRPIFATRRRFFTAPIRYTVNGISTFNLSTEALLQIAGDTLLFSKS